MATGFVPRFFPPLEAGTLEAGHKSRLGFKFSTSFPAGKICQRSAAQRSALGQAGAGVRAQLCNAAS